jgi:ferrochelatase
LLNLGGPKVQEDVEGFLYNLFADPDIIRLPSFISFLQKPIAKLISTTRAPKAKEAYASIGGGSPILMYTEKQAALLKEKLLEKHGVSVNTYIGMRYWHPFTEQALEQIEADGVDELVVLPLYPQYSVSTSGSSLSFLREEFEKDPELWGDVWGNAVSTKFGGVGAATAAAPATTAGTTPYVSKYGASAKAARAAKKPPLVHAAIPAWYKRPGYLKAMAGLISKELEGFTPDQLAKSPVKHVLFSAHGVPKSYVDSGDPYQEQIKECVSLISELLPVGNDLKIHLSYQSRVGPIEWLRPYTDDKLPELGAAGVKNLVVVPISFVSEHIETLEEIDLEYRELAEESGVENWRRCPALNTDPVFIEDMADMVVEELGREKKLTVAEACMSMCNIQDCKCRKALAVHESKVNGAADGGEECDFLGLNKLKDSLTEMLGL